MTRIVCSISDVEALCYLPLPSILVLPLSELMVVIQSRPPVISGNKLHRLLLIAFANQFVGKSTLGAREEFCEVVTAAFYS